MKNCKSCSCQPSCCSSDGDMIDYLKASILAMTILAMMAFGIAIWMA